MARVSKRQMKKKRRTPATARKASVPSTSGHYLKILAGALLLVGILGAAALVGLVLLPHTPPDRTAGQPDVPVRRPPFEVYPETDHLPDSPPCGPAHAPSVRPKVAIIIDDMGYDRALAGRFINLGIPLTFSILPHSPRGRGIARTAREHDIEIMLHLPMEPDEYPAVNPGDGVLLTSMGPDELIARMEADLNDIPHVAGINNHMGSKMTADSTRMYQVFSVLKKHGLFFVDSRTTPESQCRPAARLLQVPFAERDVFLDNDSNVAAIEAQIDRVIAVAKRNGKAVAIGHAHGSTCTALEKHLATLTQQVELVPASHLVCLVPR